MLKMKQAYPVEIYISEPGYIAFKQERADWPDQENNLVLLSYEQALILKDYLPQLMASQEEAWNGGLEEKDADLV